MRQIVTYIDHHGDTVKGLLVDDKIQVSVTGKQFLFVDSFANRVLIENVISITTAPAILKPQAG